MGVDVGGKGVGGVAPEGRTRKGTKEKPYRCHNNRFED